MEVFIVFAVLLALVIAVVVHNARPTVCPDCDGAGTPNPLTPDNRCSTCKGKGTL